MVSGENRNRSTEAIIRLRIGAVLPEAILMEAAKVSRDDLDAARKLWQESVPAITRRLLDAKPVNSDQNQ